MGFIHYINFHYQLSPNYTGRTTIEHCQPLTKAKYCLAVFPSFFQVFVSHRGRTASFVTKFWQCHCQTADSNFAFFLVLKFKKNLCIISVRCLQS